MKDSPGISPGIPPGIPLRGELSHCLSNLLRHQITIVDVKFKDLHELHVELVGYRPISTCNSRLKVDRSGHTCNETDYSDVQNVSSQAKVV